MTKFLVEVKVHSDITFEVSGYDSEEDVIKKIEGDFDVFGLSTKEFQKINSNVGCVEVTNIESI